MRIGILGTGKIACDLLSKVIKSSNLECILFSGRRVDSDGILFAKQNNITTSTEGIKAILENPKKFDLVFDASSASAHLEHAEELKKCNLPVINLTPAPIGKFCVPAIDKIQLNQDKNISMITCGAQACIPVIHSILKMIKGIHYIETVTTISSKSAGIATRRNVSEYQEITESAIRYYSHCQKAKAILLLNPAEPPVIMQSTIYILAKNVDLSGMDVAIEKVAESIRSYVPGYKIVRKPILDSGRLVIMIHVLGSGDYLPTYAGNLDIITGNAIQLAANFA